jgi:tRNA U34 5-methylaminomethyl-2-thiouridine-forming methyltransferase MnmC
MKHNRTIQTELTSDGSQTLYIPEIDEHYHSVKGAVTESLHVYLKLGFEQVLQRATSAPSIRVFEVGFGTGLNALLTLEATQHQQAKVVYTSVELYPLDWKEAQILAYGDLKTFKRIHEQPWNQEMAITNNFTLHKIQGDILQMEIPVADVVYFDAFAPEKQPELWTPTLFRRIYEAMTPGGVLTTYCAKGIVRRMLQEVGFHVERLQGPPGGKREVLRATKVDSLH